MEQVDPANTAPRRPRRLVASCLLVALLLCVGLAVAAVVGGRNLLSRAQDAASTTPPVADTGEVPSAVTVTPDETSAESEVESTRIVGSEGLPDGRIAFVDDGGRLGTVNPDGGEKRLLTGEDTVLLFPAWSPDGTMLAAVGRDSGESGVFAVEDSATASLRALHTTDEGAPIYLYWAPSGEQVSFIASHEDGFGLYLVPSSGDEGSRLLATGAPFYWQWSKNGEQVLIHTGADDENARLAFVEVAAGEIGNNLAAPGYFQAPGISAGGDYLAWAEVDAAGARWLVVEESATGEGKRLPHLGSVALGWSPVPGDERLAFVSPAGREELNRTEFFGPLRLVDASASEVEVAVVTRQFVLAFFWSPDGRTIAYLTLPGEDDGLQAVRPGSRRSKGAAQHSDVQLALWIADIEAGTTQRLLTFRPTALYLSQFLPFFDQYALSHSVWSPDGSALVLPVAGQEDEENEVYVVPVNGDDPWPIAKGNIGFWSP